MEVVQGSGYRMLGFWGFGFGVLGGAYGGFRSLVGDWGAQAKLYCPALLATPVASFR